MMTPPKRTAMMANRDSRFGRMADGSLTDPRCGERFATGGAGRVQALDRGAVDRTAVESLRLTSGWLARLNSLDEMPMGRFRKLGQANRATPGFESAPACQC